MRQQPRIKRGYDQFSDCTWEHNLNHPVDFPVKRHKAFHTNLFDLPEMICMANDVGEDHDNEDLEETTPKASDTIEKTIYET